MKHSFFTIVSLVLLSVMAFAQDDGFTSLSTIPNEISWTENGKSAAGWVKRGGEATFAVENNEIVGRRGPGDNTFLCTEKNYSNFILRFDVKFDIDCNSGVQFRTETRSAAGKDQIIGYQCEIDPNGQTANIYDERRRNRFLVPTEQMKADPKDLYKKGEWNKIVIQCVGPSIKTWLNGEKIVDLMDLTEINGIIGLQVHSGEQGQVRWRNIEIKELPATPWKLLYSNKVLGPVEIKPVGKWEVLEDGSLQGTTEPGEPRDGMLNSVETYKNFAVKVSFKMVSGNSGLYFRAVEVDKPYWYRGFQCEIAEGAPCSGLWEVQGRGWVAKNEELAKEKYRKDDWNDVGTVAVGDHLVTFLNGWTAVDIVDPECLKEGKTGLQLHGGGNQGFQFRDYFIMPLDDEAVKLIQEK